MGMRQPLIRLRWLLKGSCQAPKAGVRTATQHRQIRHSIRSRFLVYADRLQNRHIFSGAALVEVLSLHGAYACRRAFQLLQQYNHVWRRGPQRPGAV